MNEGELWGNHSNELVDKLVDHPYVRGLKPTE